MQTVSQSNFPTCSTCGKHQGTCICAGSSDPWADLQGKVAGGTSVSIDYTKTVEEKPVSKWADECRETAKKVLANPPPEPQSLYIYMLERCKYACTAGDFVKIFFWKTHLPLWSKKELEMAADLLREDNFKVELYPLDEDIRVHISWE